MQDTYGRLHGQSEVVEQLACFTYRGKMSKDLIN